jgi:hypothetical protein
MNPLLDINVVLDVLLARQPWFVEAQQVWDTSRNGSVKAALAAFSVPTIFYVVHRQTDLAGAQEAVRICLEMFEIIPIQRSTLELARTYPGNDFEDNLQIACAVEGLRDSVVTRDPNGFRHSPVPALTPAELIARLGKAAPGQATDHENTGASSPG